MMQLVGLMHVQAVVESLLSHIFFTLRSLHLDKTKSLFIVTVKDD